MPEKKNYLLKNLKNLYFTISLLVPTRSHRNTNFPFPIAFLFLSKISQELT